MEIKNNRIYLTEEEKKNPKKMTGTRLSAILGLNQYCSPFQCWAEMLRVYEPPFEDSIYTLAGKAVEPKQAEYIRENYSSNIIYPKEIFGEDYFNKTRGNFFTDDHFGGMWDYLDKTGETINCVYEMKTAGKSKRADWKNDKIPESYALQASLYAYLLNVDEVKMVATFLDQKAGDYIHPENVVVSEFNTIIKPFKVSEKYPRFKEDYIEPALNWWNEFIETGISPEYDLTTDEEVISTIKKEHSLVEPTNAMQPLDDLIYEIQETLTNFSACSKQNISYYIIQLSAAIYFMSGKAEKEQDNIARTKVEHAKVMLETLYNLNNQSFTKSIYS